MLEGITSRIPLWLKRIVLRPAINQIQQQVTDWRLQRSVQAFRKSPEPDRGLIERLRHDYGNESWSADLTYVSEIVSRVDRSTTDVLECGSGLTTLVAALVAERRNQTIWSLEQDPEWAELVRHRLSKNKIRNVKVMYAPLRDYGGYVWYDIKNGDLPNHFDLVLCDGPAVMEECGGSYANWRYGVLAVLTAKGVRVDELLLDDATEPRAANLLAKWQKEFGFNFRLIRATDGDCAIVRREI